LEGNCSASKLLIYVCAVALAILITAGTQTVAGPQNPDLDKYFSQNIGLSQSQISAIRNGQPVTKALPSRTPDETYQASAPGLSLLAYIGTASTTEFGVRLRVNPRWFRLGDKKEAAGVCRGCGESMEIESELADN
jgi:hypothetical protein